MQSQGKRQYLLSVVFLKAFPIGLFAAAFDLFPPAIQNPFPTFGRIVLFLAFWGVFGLLIGLANWRSSESKFGLDDSVEF